MTEQETLTLEVASAEHTSNSKGGWKRYTVVTADGQSVKVLIQPDVEYEPKSGDKLVFFKGSFDSWVLDRECIGLTYDPPANGTGTPTVKSGGYNSAKDKYWEEKDKYERTQRDPRIEFQSYFTHVLGIYAAAIPKLTDPPKTTQAVDAYIDDAYAKAEAIFARRQKVFAKNEG